MLFRSLVLIYLKKKKKEFSPLNRNDVIYVEAICHKEGWVQI